ncbi:MAG: nitrogen regulation protein NR(II) [Candidatus Binatia bacterium]
MDAIVVGIERRQAQDELGASELRWRTLTEALPQLVWTCRIDGSCDYLNQQWLLYTGVSLDELLGWGWTQTVHPDDVSLVRAKWSTVVEAREIFEMEYRLRSKDGNYRWFKARGIPLHDTITNTIKWFGVTSDIQDQKLAQETLQTARDELERRVQERTAELREMNEALRSEITERVRAEEALHRSERLAMLTTAATKLAHEIGNPLNGLSTTVQIMERFLKKQSPSEDESLDAFLQDLRAEIARLQSLVQNWRSLSSMTRIDLRPHSLSRLVADVLRSQVQYYTELGIILCESIPPDLPPILADANSLAQVILNLSKNAIEAMPGGGTLTLDAARKEDQVVLHISDSGKGIPESLNIFEPFTTTKENGTGLGLAIVQQVISAHGGTITYRSTPGEGTTFTLTLAVAPTENENSFASRSHV